MREKKKRRNQLTATVEYLAPMTQIDGSAVPGSRYDRLPLPKATSARKQTQARRNDEAILLRAVRGRRRAARGRGKGGINKILKRTRPLGKTRPTKPLTRAAA